MARVIVYLYDGREIDLSDLEPDAAIAKLRAAGVALEDIRETRHYIRIDPAAPGRVGQSPT